MLIDRFKEIITSFRQECLALKSENENIYMESTYQLLLHRTKLYEAELCLSELMKISRSSINDEQLKTKLVEYLVNRGVRVKATDLDYSASHDFINKFHENLVEIIFGAYSLIDKIKLLMPYVQQILVFENINNDFCPVRRPIGFGNILNNCTLQNIVVFEFVHGTIKKTLVFPLTLLKLDIEGNRISINILNKIYLALSKNFPAVIHMIKNHNIEYSNLLKNLDFYQDQPSTLRKKLLDLRDVCFNGGSKTTREIEASAYSTAFVHDFCIFYKHRLQENKQYNFLRPLIEHFSNKDSCIEIGAENITKILEDKKNQTILDIEIGNLANDILQTEKDIIEFLRKDEPIQGQVNYRCLPTEELKRTLINISKELYDKNFNINPIYNISERYGMFFNALSEEHYKYVIPIISNPMFEQKVFLNEVFLYLSPSQQKSFLVALNKSSQPLKHWITKLDKLQIFFNILNLNVQERFNFYETNFGFDDVKKLVRDVDQLEKLFSILHIPYRKRLSFLIENFSHEWLLNSVKNINDLKKISRLLMIPLLQWQNFYQTILKSKFGPMNEGQYIKFYDINILASLPNSEREQFLNKCLGRAWLNFHIINTRFLYQLFDILNIEKNKRKDFFCKHFDTTWIEKNIYFITSLKNLVEILDLDNNEINDFFQIYLNNQIMKNLVSNFFDLEIMLNTFPSLKKDALNFFTLFFDKNWCQRNININQIHLLTYVLKIKKHNFIDFCEQHFGLEWIVEQFATAEKFSSFLKVTMKNYLEGFDSLKPFLETKAFNKNLFSFSCLHTLANDFCLSTQSILSILNYAMQEQGNLKTTSLEDISNFIRLSLIIPSKRLDFFRDYFGISWVKAGHDSNYILGRLILLLFVEKNLVFDFFDEFYGLIWVKNNIKDIYSLNKLTKSVLNLSIEDKVKFIDKYFDESWLKNNVNVNNFYCFCDYFIPFGFKKVETFDKYLGKDWLDKNIQLKQDLVIILNNINFSQEEEQIFFDQYLKNNEILKNFYKNLSHNRLSFFNYSSSLTLNNYRYNRQFNFN